MSRVDDLQCPSEVISEWALRLRSKTRKRAPYTSTEIERRAPENRPEIVSRSHHVYMPDFLPFVRCDQPVSSALGLIWSSARTLGLEHQPRISPARLGATELAGYYASGEATNSNRTSPCGKEILSVMLPVGPCHPFPRSCLETRAASVRAYRLSFGTAWQPRRSCDRRPKPWQSRGPTVADCGIGRSRRSWQPRSLQFRRAYRDYRDYPSCTGAQRTRLVKICAQSCSGHGNRTSSSHFRDSRKRTSRRVKRSRGSSRTSGKRA